MPEIGRFITPDISSETQKEDPMTMNAYTYCSNNSTRYVDSDGRFQTREENGVQIAFRIEPETALLKDVLHIFIPSSRTIENIVRRNQRDLTLSNTQFLTDVADEIITIIAGVLPREAGIAIEQTRRQLAEGERKSPYESLSEFQKSLLDKKIFEEYTGIKNPRKIVLGQGKVKRQLNLLKNCSMRLKSRPG